jgi:hypothetical protein
MVLFRLLLRISVDMHDKTFKHPSLAIELNLVSQEKLISRKYLLCVLAFFHPVTFFHSEMVHAHGSEEVTLEEVVVEGRRLNLTGEARSASEGRIGQEDLELRPLLRPGDVLESIPGLIMTQHSGTGKGNQMFLRGFNLDHGTDFSTQVDGMPVNLRTHGHGQGYTDINFLIPELIRTIDYVKGPYHAELGDFSSTGGANIRTFNRLAQGQLSLGLGENGYGRALAAGGTEMGGGYLLGALEGQVYDGPWTDIDEDLEKVNGLLRYSGERETGSYAITAMFYDANWNSADQIPERAVEQGLIDPLGSLDRTLGGKTRRSSLSGSFNWEAGRHRNEINAWIIDYDFKLWSNFTYLLENPVQGDQFEQVDDRKIYGGDWSLKWLGEIGGGHLHHMLGVQFRYDDIGAVGLYNTRERERLGVVRLDSVDETSVGIYYELEWRINDRWRSVIGMRGDYYWFDVDSNLEQNSGSESDGIFSPKASLIYTIDEVSEAYLSGGFGFHSNDARGTTISVDPVTGESVLPVDALVRSNGGEIGFRTVWLDTWNASFAVWYLKLDSELLFVGDAGNTEASRPSRRWGVEFNNIWRVTDIWSIEADFAWTTVITGAVTATWPSGWFGSLRLRYFGAAPLIEDGSVESDGSSMANLLVGWSNERWRLRLEVLNLFDSKDHDIDYFYASRLSGEPANGVDDIHYHIFEPRQARIQASFLF